jgi:flavodoxin/ferredoxin
MDSVIYYYSATGNSLKVAKDIALKLDDTKLIKINKDNMVLAKENKYKRVGIVFPVYYYGLPVMVKEFVEKLNADKDSYVFAVATCGGSVGAALKQLKNIFDKKNDSLSSAFTVVMPDNYQVMYSPPPLEKQQRLFSIESKKADYIVEKIKKCETDIFEEEGSIAAKLLGGMLSKNFNPREKDKNFWTDEKCNGCSTCFKVCPNNNILMEGNKPKWLHECGHCLACMHWCPKRSIQYKKGTIKRDRYHHPEVKVNELFNR